MLKWLRGLLGLVSRKEFQTVAQQVHQVRQNLHQQRQLQSAPPDLEVSINEAGSQDLAKQAKLATLDKAMMSAHFAQIGQDELAAVRALRAKHGLAPAPGDNGEDMDIIVCDDYHRNDPSPSRLWPVVAIIGFLAVAGLAGYLGYLALNRPTPPPAENITNKAGFSLELIPPPPK